MKQKKLRLTIQTRLIPLIVIFLIGEKTFAQNPVNWNPDQLMNPAVLDSILKHNNNIPVIFSVGPGGIIPHSKDIGMVREAENLKMFKEELAKLPKDTQVVIYCGCCPYDHCPNVRPAVQALKDMKFTNFKLLDLPHNIKIDWINKGYPYQN